MPLDRLIDLLAEAAVRKLSQEREKQKATPDATWAACLKRMKKRRRTAWPPWIDCHDAEALAKICEGVVSRMSVARDEAGVEPMAA